MVVTVRCVERVLLLSANFPHRANFKLTFLLCALSRGRVSWKTVHL